MKSNSPTPLEVSIVLCCNGTPIGTCSCITDIATSASGIWGPVPILPGDIVKATAHAEADSIDNYPSSAGIYISTITPLSGDYVRGGIGYMIGVYAQTRTTIED